MSMDIKASGHPITRELDDLIRQVDTALSDIDAELTSIADRALYCRKAGAPVTLAYAGLEVNQPNSEGDFPIHEAIKSKDAAAVKALIARGANPNQRTERAQTTPLELATRYLCPDVVKVLLEAGADTEAELGIFKSKILHHAIGMEVSTEEARYNRYCIVKLLLDHGANVNAEDSDGHTLIDEAFDMEIPYVGEMFDTPERKERKKIARRDQKQIVQLLLSRGATIPDDAEDKTKHNTPCVRGLVRDVLQGVRIYEPKVKPPVKLDLPEYEVLEPGRHYPVAEQPSYLSRITSAATYAFSGLFHQ